MTPRQLLEGWFSKLLPAHSLSWLKGQEAVLRDGAKPSQLYLSFSLVPRFTGKEPLRLAEQDLAIARQVRPNWDAGDLTVDQAVRLWLLQTVDLSAEPFHGCLDTLFATADLAELVLLYRGLPLYPDPDRFRLRAAEGIRSSMKIVFEAVALRNPYPYEQLPDDAWNQMVLKALFLESSLHCIFGLDRRRNAVLARMLHDYAHERWSAGRPVSYELWRCVGPFLTGDRLEDLERVLNSDDPRQKQAAALALACSPDPKARQLLKTSPALSIAVSTRTITWQSLTAASNLTT